MRAVVLTFLLILIGGGVTCPSYSAWAQSGTGEVATFFTLLPDVPLMSGLQEVPEESLVFDKPAGRIVEAVAVTSTQTPESIENYYLASLPQLGWTPVEKNKYIREGESLQVKIESHETGIIVRLSVMPQ